MTTPEQQAYDLLGRMGLGRSLWVSGDVVELANLIEERDRLRDAIGRAYGFLWCANDEPGTPHRYPSEIAANEARKILIAPMTKKERWKYISAAVKEVRGHQC